jgi:hypothetical protein
MKTGVLDKAGRRIGRACVAEDIEEDGLTLIQIYCFEEGFRACARRFGATGQLRKSIATDMERWVARVMTSTRSER